jgi:predicted metal-dependent hydrolase
MPAQLNFDDILTKSGFYLEINANRVPVSFRESRRARHYTIYVRSDGTVTITVPRRGSIAGAQRFLESRRAWIARTLQKLRSRPAPPKVWQAGTEVFYRGKRVVIRIDTHGSQPGLGVYLDQEFCGFARNDGDVRSLVEGRLQKIAVIELTQRVQDLAAQHQSPVRRITVRDQRSRWGSCSPQGTISLNWRLVQLPNEVRDYVILHELMHFREMNHSRRFWAHVARACPNYEEHERWLKTYGPSLGL